MFVIRRTMTKTKPNTAPTVQFVSSEIVSYLPFFLIFLLFTPELSSIPVSPLSPPLSLSSSVHIPLFMLRHTLCLHLLLAIYSSPYLSTHPFLTFPSPLLSPSPNPIPLSTPLSISFPQEMVSFPKKGGGGVDGGWKGVHTVPNKEVSVWILQKFREEKEGR